MRFTMNYCARANCDNRTLAGFRFCRQKNCGKKDEEE